MLQAAAADSSRSCSYSKTPPTCRRSTPMKPRSRRSSGTCSSNGLKFTERGEVRVSALVRRRRPRMVVFRVADTGIGIAAENQSIVFEEFGQVEHRLQRRARGTGLGLPLSRRLAELLGGTLTLQSESGAGSVFTVTLPANYVAARPAAPQVSWTVDADRLPVLTLEDAPGGELVYERMLKGSPFQPLPVRSGCRSRRCPRQRGARRHPPRPGARRTRRGTSSSG